jgi:hypothetical protein
MKVSIRGQIDAVELILCNRKGHIDNLRGLVRSKKRPPEELEVAERPIPGLEAALRTLKWVEANEVEIKKAIERQRQA